MNMWLPSTVYESLPCAYVVIGVLFLAGVLYVGYQGYGLLVYVALGIVSILCGLLVYYIRRTFRRNSASRQSVDSASR